MSRRLNGSFPLLLSLLAAWQMLGVRSHAHQLDEYLQATLVTFEPRVVRLQMNLTPGVEVAGPLLAEIDRDSDGILSAPETAAYAESVRKDLVVRLDDRELPLKSTAREFPAPDELRTGWGIIQLEFSADFGALAAGPHHLTVQNRHRHNSSAYLVNAALPPPDLLEITSQKRKFNQSTGEIEFTWHPPASPTSKSHLLIFVAILAATVGRIVWGRVAENTSSPYATERV